MLDGHGRTIDYLRLTVTDRSNMRCLNCLPKDAQNFTASKDLLSDDEIVYFVERFLEKGFKKIRITGGEPLVRPGIVNLVERIAKTSGITDVSMTTNGVLLGEMASDLKAAGLKRVNVSLDTLDPERFLKITRFGDFFKVMKGLDAAEAAGLGPIKLNVVVARGMNDDELEAFAQLTESRNIHVRFIELMPMGDTGFFSDERRVTIDEMGEKLGRLIPLEANCTPIGNGPARYYKREGALGTIGLISALSCGFCDTCNRVRLTATGTLVPCLDGEEGLDLLGPLRAGKTAAEIRRLIDEGIAGKPMGHSMIERAATAQENPRYMCSIGG